MASARVWVIVRRLPVPAVRLAVDPLHVVRTLSVAVPRAVLGPALVNGKSKYRNLKSLSTNL